VAFTAVFFAVRIPSLSRANRRFHELRCPWAWPRNLGWLRMRSVFLAGRWLVGTTADIKARAERFAQNWGAVGLDLGLTAGATPSR